MKYNGTIIRTEHGRGGVTLIVETPIGLRGVELDRDVWAAIMADFGLEPNADISGWRVTYDPVHGDLDLTGEVPDDGTPE